MIYIAIAVVSVILLFGGIRTIFKLGKDSKQLEYDNFVISLNTVLEKQRLQSVGSLKDQTFSVPRDVELVCFFDDHKEVRAFRNSEVAEFRKANPDYNIFFSPSRNYYPDNLEHVSLREDENPLCIEPVNSKIRLGLQSEGRTTQITSLIPDAIEEDCVSVLYQGDPQDKIDVVFLGYGYKSSESFESDVNARINNVMFNIYPFNENKYKFNIYRVDKFDINCQIGSFIQCDSFNIKKVAAKCPNDYIFVLVERSFLSDAVNPVRSSAIGNLAKINTADNEFVLMHEFGHSFPSPPLADEYIGYAASFDASSYPNCDSVPCTKWAGITTNCIQGCSTNSYYRSNETSLMRDLNDRFYGSVNEFELFKILEAYP